MNDPLFAQSDKNGDNRLCVQNLSGLPNAAPTKYNFVDNVAR
jgi:hypothetical protein